MAAFRPPSPRGEPGCARLRTDGRRSLESDENMFPGPPESLIDRLGVESPGGTLPVNFPGGKSRGEVPSQLNQTTMRTDQGLDSNEE